MCSRLFNCPRAIRAIICLFLACLLVFCFIAPPYLQAYAIVDIILSGAISSTMSALFTLSGIKFASSSDLISGIELAWANFDKATQQLISDVVGVGNPIGGAFIEPTTIPLPVALISGFVTAIQKVFPITQTSVPSLPSTSILTNIPPATRIYYTVDGVQHSFRFYYTFSPGINPNGLIFELQLNGETVRRLWHPTNILDFRNDFSFTVDLKKSDAFYNLVYGFSYLNTSGVRVVRFPYSTTELILLSL